MRTLFDWKIMSGKASLEAMEALLPLQWNELFFQFISNLLPNEIFLFWFQYIIFQTKGVLFLTLKSFPQKIFNPMRGEKFLLFGACVYIWKHLDTKLFIYFDPLKKNQANNLLSACLLIRAEALAFVASHVNCLLLE